MSVASLLITVKPSRVRGFIYVVAGRIHVGAGLPALSVWAQKPQFTNQIQWIFSIYIIFGHRQSFLKNCSPCPIPFWAQQRFLQEKFQLSLESKENISSKHAVCAQSRFIAIETIVSVFQISSPVPKRPCRQRPSHWYFDRSTMPFVTSTPSAARSFACSPTPPKANSPASSPFAFTTRKQGMPLGSGFL